MECSPEVRGTRPGPFESRVLSLCKKAFLDVPPLRDPGPWPRSEDDAECRVRRSRAGHGNEGESRRAVAFGHSVRGARFPTRAGPPRPAPKRAESAKALTPCGGGVRG